jgi:hypothetical protein
MGYWSRKEYGKASYPFDVLLQCQYVAYNAIVSYGRSGGLSFSASNASRVFDLRPGKTVSFSLGSEHLGKERTHVSSPSDAIRGTTLYFFHFLRSISLVLWILL